MNLFQRVALLLVTIVSVAWSAETTADARQMAFEGANSAYRLAQSITGDSITARDHYLRAARRYEWLILEAGLSNSSLYFNLANSLLGAEDYGRAILNYRRALLLSPGEPVVEKNLAVARRQLADVTMSSPVSNDWAVVARYLPLLSVGLWVLLWALLIYRLFRPQAIERSAITITGAATVTVLVLMMLSAYGFGVEYGVLTANESVARRGDGLGYEASMAEPLRAGQEFRILEQRSHWAQVELPTGVAVWLPSSDFEVVEEMP